MDRASPHVPLDPLIGSDLSIFSSPTRDAQYSYKHTIVDTMQCTSEQEPLLGASRLTKKPFYRPRPLWLVPFAVATSIVRGMTLAPRVEVFTQLSCASIYPHNHSTYDLQTHPPFPWHPNTSTTLARLSLDPLTQSATILSFQNEPDESDDPRDLPSVQCLSDPSVQAAAARLQTIMTTTMGLLSAFSTGWWGHFGERHGRTAVLAISTFGLFITDLAFILVSTPSSRLSAHHHHLLIISPFLEGLLGGFSTVQAATTAYISDCTSPGSRAQIFSRFAGVMYLGFSAGPTLGAWLITHPILARYVGGEEGRSVTTVFWVAIICSLINCLLVLFVVPESFPAERRDLQHEDYPSSSAKPQTGIINGFFSPLAVFLPVRVDIGNGRRKDWSQTLLAAALFGSMISSGLFQVKYLYATHVYGWGAEQLSYYISFLGGARAIWLLVLLPYIITSFKPKAKQPKSVAPGAVSITTSTSMATTKKPAPTKAHLAREIAFDLSVTRLSFLIDILSQSLITFSPAPSYSHALVAQASDGRSQTLFVLLSSLSALGSGVAPSIQSLALLINQSRLTRQPGIEGEEGEGAVTVGRLFGGLAVLQAIGQMILGPLLFGVIYSSTVAVVPKAIFIASGTILTLSLLLVCLVTPPKTKRKRMYAEVERGRSRVSKDLRGGAATMYGVTGPSNSMEG